MIDLDAIKARCEAATPGPWEVNGSPHDRHIATVGRHHITKPDRAGRSAHNDEIAKFIAHARTDVPALVAEVERLRKYAKHTHKCRMQPWFEQNWCTCGLDAGAASIPAATGCDA